MSRDLYHQLASGLNPILYALLRLPTLAAPRSARTTRVDSGGMVDVDSSGNW